MKLTVEKRALHPGALILDKETLLSLIGEVGAELELVVSRGETGDEVLRFHPEMTPELVQEITKRLSDDRVLRDKVLELARKRTKGEVYLDEIDMMLPDLALPPPRREIPLQEPAVGSKKKRKGKSWQHDFRRFNR